MQSVWPLSRYLLIRTVNIYRTDGTSRSPVRIASRTALIRVM